MAAVVNQLLNDVLRPKSMKQIILLDRIRNVLGDGKLNQNYLLESSSPGTGKSSLSRILSAGCSTLTIHCRLEANVEFIRNTLGEFCSTRSMIHFDTDYKVVVLEEFDGASAAFLDALKPFIEKFSESVRFVANCNFITKIPEAIRSRFSHIQFYPLNTEEEEELTALYYKRLNSVTKKLGMKWESKETLLEFISRNFPDIRTMISKLQYFQDSGVEVITLDMVQRASFSFEELYQLMVDKPDPHANYKLIMAEYSTKVADVFYSLGQEFPDWLSEMYPDKLMALPVALINIADYEFKSRASIDPVLSLLACVFSIQKSFNQ